MTDKQEKIKASLQSTCINIPYESRDTFVNDNYTESCYNIITPMCYYIFQNGSCIIRAPLGQASATLRNVVVFIFSSQILCMYCFLIPEML